MQEPQPGVLMSSYSHQDWADLGRWETLELYLSDSTGNDVEQLALDLDVALRLRDDDELEHLVSELGGCVYLREEPDGYRGFVEEIARRVEAWLQA